MLSTTPCSEDTEKTDALFSEVHSNRLTGNENLVEGGKSQLDIRKKFFTFIIRVVKYGIRTPREVKGSPSLEVFETQLDEP